MVKYKPWKKGTLTYGFGCSPGYVASTGRCHSGIDWTKGWGTKVTTDTAGYVYKVHKPWTREDNWTAVHILTAHTDGTVVETVYGHLSYVAVKEGDTVSEDQYIGNEGNYGYVFSGGRQITVEMQKLGNRAGSHVHQAYRPCYRTKVTEKGSHYLWNADFSPYQDPEGYYYKIIHDDNNFKGCIDPMYYKVSRPSDLLRTAFRLKYKNDNDYNTLLKFADLLRMLGN